jgi:hypothetical protein
MCVNNILLHSNIAVLNLLEAFYKMNIDEQEFLQSEAEYHNNNHVPLLDYAYNLAKIGEQNNIDNVEL